MTFLNVDIVEHIIDSYDHWWPRDYYRLALISFIWLQPVRKRLYAGPSLLSYRSCHYLARTLEENREINALVRRLDIRPSFQASWLNEEREMHKRGVCPGAPRLLALASVEQLTLGGDLAAYAHRYLRMVGSPQTIRALTIFEQVESRSPASQIESFTWDEELASRFIALEKLTLDGPIRLDIDDMHYDPDGETEHTSSILGRGCMLRELHLSGVGFAEGSGPLCALLREPASWSRLHTLTFSIEECTRQDYERLLSLLDVVHETLEHLRFFSRHTASDGFHDPFDQLRSIAPLRRLRSLTTSYGFMHEVFRPIISRVETLCITGAFNTSHIFDWAILIDPGKRNAFANLRKLTLRLTDSPTQCLPESHTTFATLRQVCERRSIELDIIRK